MSKHYAELCALLIEVTYGELPARIFSTLLIYGRLPLFLLNRHSDLPPKYVKNGLVVLLQQGLAFYHISTDDGLTYYEANTRTAYTIVRTGKYEQMLYDLYNNEDVANLMSTLYYHGYAGSNEILSVEDVKIVEKPLVEERKLRKKENDMLADGANGNGVDGHDHDEDENMNGINGIDVAEEDEHEVDDETTLGTRREACRKLFQSSHVVKFRDEDLMPDADFHALVEKTVKEKEYGGEVRGTKTTAAFNESVKKRKVEWLDNNRVTEKQLDAPRIPGTASKRGRDLDDEQAEAGQSSKRRRGNAGQTLDDSAVGMTKDEASDKEETLPSWNVFRLNREKLEVSQRSHYFRDLAARSFGEITAGVYHALLRKLEHQIPRCHDEYLEAADDDDEGDDTGIGMDDDRYITTTAFDVEAELPNDFLIKPLEERHHKEKVKSETNHDGETITVNGHHEHDHPTDSKAFHQRRVGFVEQHLRILSTSSYNFIIRLGSRGQGEYRCDFQSLTRRLMQFELDNLILSRFGADGRRIIRILHDKGKLDEKQLGALALLKQKDLRAKLTAMQEAGYVDTQEVPRDNSRQPSRTIYLWFYDQERCRKLVLNDVYKGMARLLQRIKVERERVAGVIEKAERTDVRGNEDKYLTKAEREALRGWREGEEKLLVQLGRQDDLVALLRDFLPMK